MMKVIKDLAWSFLVIVFPSAIMLTNMGYFIQNDMVFNGLINAFLLIPLIFIATRRDGEEVR